MAAFFKKFGQGLLYLITLPVLIVVLSVYAFYGIVIFLIMLIKSIILFFQGKTVDSDLPEDIEAKRRLAPKPAQESIVVVDGHDETIVDAEVEDENVIIPTKLNSNPTPTFLEEPNVVGEIPHEDEIPVEEETPLTTPNFDLREENDTFFNDEEEINIAEEIEPASTSTSSRFTDVNDDDDDDDNGVTISSWGEDK